MVVHAETSAQSIALFIRRTHDTGNFIELLAQYQYGSQTRNADKRFWAFHGCIFRISFGHATSGEMIDPTSGVWTSLGTEQPTTANAVQPHFGPLGSTQDWPDKFITEIQGCEAIQAAEPT